MFLRAFSAMAEERQKGKWDAMQKAKVILLSGQSNAVGVGHTKYLSKHYDRDTVDQIQKGYEAVSIRYVSHDIKNQGFEPVAIGQTEKKGGTLGPEIGIARKLTELWPNEKFFIIKCAFGGSDMHIGWRSPSSGVPYDRDAAVVLDRAVHDAAYRFEGWCYHEQIAILDEGFAQLQAMGYEPEVIAFCWMQGESDTALAERAEPYIFRYDCMLGDLRNRYAGAFQNCVYIDAGISDIWKNYQVMNQRKKAYADQNGHRFIDTLAAGLTTRNEPEEQPDIYHYDLNSTVRLGELFVEELREALSQKTTEPV